MIQLELVIFECEMNNSNVTEYCAYATCASTINRNICSIQMVSSHTHAHVHEHIYQNVFKGKLCKMLEVPKSVFQQRLKSVAVIPGHNPLAPPSFKNILFNALSAHGACVTQTRKKSEEKSEISENLYKIKLIKWT